ncbi:BZ3500_MvSof-1268-A1-R1_Chr5-2g08046 [Microbotryum saponariae]|uniref:BZ3500_MvSof-1268-A1-R1_Chr5-2g08046 protein n=1 Tax=Microbotryum saponariae TaxID=289078 RepID=A0A2X0KLF8_9BASI|nr:BZ3500_MvSof-1268-A1-R1_Chr5-2g08046 [Microbotryum saponariae]SDA05915.1 BZ3501_MvSof-1269-A2-R1_Chr5-2g07868 [Microbotryum saponariae]
MVKIRKKSSKRTTTHMRSKVAKKVSESHRKAKKTAKKDVTWKSNKPKELGIPNSFPYKDQLLAEAAAEKAQAEAEKQARREASRNGTSATLASTAALAAALAADSQRLEDESAFSDEEEGEAQVNDASLKLHAKSLRKVLEASDVLIEVLDARDPVGTRCRAVERELKGLDGGRKKLVLVLNKIVLSHTDLVPPPVVQAWLAYLRTQAPTIPFKSSTQQQRQHLSASSAHTPTNASGSSTKPLMELIKGFRINPTPSTSTEQKVKHSLTIGLIGHPNVGKSSLINTLKRSKACSVAPTPGWTKEVQEVVLEKGIRVLDCPGVVVEARGEVEGSLRGMVKAEDVRDPKAPIELILQRCKKEHLQMLYNIPAFIGTNGFLLEVARAKGRLRKGGVPDIEGTARSILQDWVAGRIPYYTSPPTVPTSSTTVGVTPVAAATESMGTVTDTDVNQSTLLTEFAPAFDLAALFGEADAVAFGEQGAAGSAVVGKAVKMEGMEVETEDSNVGWVTGEVSEDEEEGGIDVDDLLDDEVEQVDEEGDVSMDVQPTKPSNKKQARSMPTIVSVAPAVSNKQKNRSVTFEPSANTVNTKSIVEETQGIGLNKANAKKAKKDKKKLNKINKEASEFESQFGEEADMVGNQPKKSRVVAGGVVGEAYSFEEFFGKKDGEILQTEEDDEEEL